MKRKTIKPSKHIIVLELNEWAAQCAVNIVVSICLTVIVLGILTTIK